MSGTPTLESARDRVLSGQVVEGMVALVALLDDAEDTLTEDERAVLLATLVDCRLARGDLAEAMTLSDGLVPMLGGTGFAAAVAHHAKGELAAALGDSEVALAHFLKAGEIAPYASVDELPWRSGAALAQLRNGHARGAAVLAREQVDLARASGTPYAMASALRTLAAVDTGPDRIQHLLRARAVLAGATADRLAAQIDTDLAGLLMLTHDPDAETRALQLLRAAEEHAGRQELWPLHGRVRRQLDRLGVQPRKVQTEAMAALTASERRVARMASEGMTNRQIAAELVVTVKAVEWHLSHVYRKLGISSRGGLAATLGATV